MITRIIRHIKLNHEIGLMLEVKDNDVPQKSFIRLFTTLVRAVKKAIHFFFVTKEILNHSPPSSFSVTSICKQDLAICQQDLAIK